MENGVVLASTKGENGRNLSISNKGRIVISPPPPAAAAINKEPRDDHGEKATKANTAKNSRIKKRSISEQRMTPEVDSPSGPIDGDYSRLKTQQNQIPIATFWSFMEQYFRKVTVEDLAALESNVNTF